MKASIKLLIFTNILIASFCNASDSNVLKEGQRKGKCDNSDQIDTVYRHCDRLINDNIVYRFREFKHTGYFDVDSFCGKFPEVIECHKNLSTLFDQCAVIDNLHQFNYFINILESSHKFMCSNNGERISSFVNDGGVECMQSNEQSLEQCAREAMGGIIPKIVPGEPYVPAFKLDASACRAMTDLEKCIVAELNSCSKSTIPNFFKDMLDFIRDNTACAIYKMCSGSDCAESLKKSCDISLEDRKKNIAVCRTAYETEFSPLFKEYEENGFLNVNKVCETAQTVLNCHKNHSIFIDTCLDSFDRTAYDNFLKMFQNLHDFACANEGDAATTFVKAGGIEFSYFRSEKINVCFRKASDSLKVAKGDDSDNYFPTLIVDQIGCRAFKDLQSCVLIELRKSPNQIPANIVDSTFGYLIDSICSSHDINEIASSN